MTLSLKPVIPNKTAGKGTIFLLGNDKDYIRLLLQVLQGLRSISGRALQVLHLTKGNLGSLMQWEATQCTSQPKDNLAKALSKVF